MKNVSLILASVVMMLIASCKGETKKTTEKTVVIEKQVEATPVKEVEEETDGTSVSISKDGVDFSTKDGDKKTKVEVKDGAASVSSKK